ncbi:hypothetical protein ABTL17_20005, partial [Acinetobacter baumannii]
RRAPPEPAAAVHPELDRSAAQLAAAPLAARSTSTAAAASALHQRATSKPSALTALSVPRWPGRTLLRPLEERQTRLPTPPL